MATTKKTDTKKKEKPKKTSFYPKIKSNKRNGIGTY